MLFAVNDTLNTGQTAPELFSDLAKRYTLLPQGVNLDPGHAFLSAAFAMGIFSRSFGFFDALALTLPQDIALEFREAAQDIEKQLGERVVVILGERQVFLHEFYGDAFCNQLTDNVLQILKAASEPVDGVDPQSVALVQSR